MYNRRKFVVGTGVGVVAVVLGLDRVASAVGAPAAAVAKTDSAVPVGMPAMVTPAMPAMPSMPAGVPVTKFVYHGHAIAIQETSDMASLVIDGSHPVHLERPDVGSYHTHLFPFTLYTDRNTLVRDLIAGAAHDLFIL